MRNVFDQYSQYENRLTHALACSLEADRVLLRKFCRWVLDGNAPPSQRLRILEQQLPGEEEAADEIEAERHGLPDAWIHRGDSWALIIESKISSPLSPAQLKRHRGVAERRGFSDVHLLAFVTSRPKRVVLDNVKVIEWMGLYSWLRQHEASEWARRLTQYMEVLERKLVVEEYLREGTLTVFAGIPFGKDNQYTYGEAKRLLRLAMDHLGRRSDLKREFRLNPGGKRRPAITGREGRGVWDYFLPFEKVKPGGAESFTNFPHLTLAIDQKRLVAVATVPHKIRREFRNNILDSGKEGFLKLFEAVHDNLKESLGTVEGAAPWMEISQRHFPSRKKAIVDAKLQFDLRTAFKVSKRWRKSVKTQPQWLDAVYEVFNNKRSNLQCGVGAIFPYEWCPAVHTPEILNNVANVWLACAPLIRRLLGRNLER